MKTEEYFIQDEPYYEAVVDEVEVFESTYRNQVPVLLKGPTGCGNRFMEYMAWRSVNAAYIRCNVLHSN